MRPVPDSNRCSPARQRRASLVRVRPGAAHQQEVSAATRTSRFYDRNAVAAAVADAPTVLAALHALGYKPGNSNYRRLREACERYRLPYPATKPRPVRPAPAASRSKIRDQEALRAALAASTTMHQVTKALGVAPARNNYDAIVRACHEFGFRPPPLKANGRRADPATRFPDRETFVAAVQAAPSTTQLLVALGRPKDWVWIQEAAAFHRVELPRGVPGMINGKLGPRAIPLEQLLVEGSTRRGTDFKKRLIDEGLLEDRCEQCSLGPEWNGRPLTLQLDHRNGINTDNRIENLRLLCPNCHSQTATWAGRNVRRPTAAA